MSGSVQEAPPVGLDVKPPGTFNPFATAQSAADLQGRMQQNQMQAQQLQARGRFGQIMATSPDLESGLNNAAKDPLVSAYGMDNIRSAREMQQFLIQNQGLQATQSNDAVSRLLSRMGAVYQSQDPVGALQAVTKSVVQGMPQAMQQRPEIRNALNSVMQGLTAGLPQQPDPGESQDSLSARQQAGFRSNVLGFMVSGVPGGVDTLKALTPTAGVQALGNKLQPYVQAPGFEGGGVLTAPGAMGTGLGPQTAPPGQVIIGGGDGAGGNGSPGAGAPPPANGGFSSRNPLIGPLPGSNSAVNPLMPGVAPPVGTGNSPRGDGWGQGAPGAPGGVAPGTDGRGMPPNDPARTQPLSFDGRPLIPPGTNMSSNYPYQTGTGGARIESPALQAINSKLADDFATTETKEYQNAVMGKSSLRLMNSEFDDAAKSGFSSPGSMQPFRLALGKFVDLVQQVTGSKETIDPSALASAQGINELSNRLGVTLTSQLLGSQREAAETIRNVTSSVPGLGDTMLGAKLKLATLEALVDRQMANYQFKTAYASQTGGDLLNADTEFNRAHPPELTTKTLMAKFGLGDDGKFNSPQAIMQAYHQGLLTWPQASGLGKKQFPDQ